MFDITIWIAEGFVAAGLPKVRQRHRSLGRLRPNPEGRPHRPLRGRRRDRPRRATTHRPPSVDGTAGCRGHLDHLADGQWLPSPQPRVAVDSGDRLVGIAGTVDRQSALGRTVDRTVDLERCAHPDLDRARPGDDHQPCLSHARDLSREARGAPSAGGRYQLATTTLAAASPSPTPQSGLPSRGTDLVVLPLISHTRPRRSAYPSRPPSRTTSSCGRPTV